MSLDSSTNETDRDIIKSVCLKFFREYLLRNNTDVFSVFEKLRDCECEYLAGERCCCTDEGASGDEDSLDDVDGARRRNGEEFDYDVHITEADNDDVDNVEVEAGTIRGTHKHISSKLKQPRSVAAQPGHYIMKKPYFLIICNVRFHYRLMPRNGASEDVRHIKEFCQHLQLPEESVVLVENLTRADMETKLVCTSTDSVLDAHDSLICFIMSHGSKDGVLGIDNQPLDVDRILDIFKGSNCPYLIGKPKLFFIQACRGSNSDSGITVPRGDIVTDNNDVEDKPIKLPSDADILVAYSTTKHQISLRSFSVNRRVKTIGSWFIYNLIRVFWEFAHKEDVLSMLQMVNNAVARMHTGSDPQEGLKQISCQLSMLRYKLYFKNFKKQ